VENIYKQEVDASNVVRYKSMKALAIASFIIALVYLYLREFAAGSVMALFGFFALYSRQYSMKSYSYIISGDQVTVERTIGGKNKSTKKMFDFRISDIVMMAPEKSEKIKELNLRPDKTMAFHMKGMVTGVYTVLTKADGKLYKIKLAPDKKFIDICQKKSKGNVIKG
jgi:hypothetical protein